MVTPQQTESEIQQLIQLQAAKLGCHLLRNNSGAFKDATGRVVFFGLGNISKHHNDRIKSSDLIGIWNGKFVAIEVKKSGWKFNPNDKREQAQLAFINWVKSNNGYAGFAASLDDMFKILYP